MATKRIEVIIIKNINRFKIETTLTIWLPLLVSLLFWNKISNRLPTHFNAQFVADSWNSKLVAIITLPIILTIAQLFLILVISKDPKEGNIHPKAQKIVFSIMPILSIIILPVIIDKALNIFPTLLQNSYFDLLFGFLFIILGLVLGKVRPNYTVGIRLPWTLHSEQNWKMTHKFGEKIYIVGGIIMIVSSFIPMISLFTPILIIDALIPCIYSYLLYKKGI